MSGPFDLSSLPAPKVVETLDFEAILAQRKSALIARFEPAERADIEAALALESDPLTKLLEENAYQEMILRNRVNDAAKATMLAFARQSDLDHIGAGKDVYRLTIRSADPDAIPPVPAVMEDDEAYRLRIQESPNGLSVAGPAKAYEFHARSADGRVMDARAISPSPCSIVIAVLSALDDGIASPTLLKIVDDAVTPETVRPLGDRVTVQSAEIIEYEIEAILYTSSGPERPAIHAAALERATALSKPRRPLGKSVYRSACNGAIHVPGAIKVEILKPAENILLTKLQAARCTAINIKTVVIDE